MTLDADFKRGNLCVVGNINRDIKTSPLPSGDHYLRDGETSVASIVETIGGGGANSACAAAGLGATVAFLGKVGADALGDKLEQTLVRHGISAHLARDKSSPTGTSIALSYANGQRHFVSCLANNESLAFEDLDLAALAGFSHLFRADIWFSKAMLFGGNERLLKIAREAGLATSIDLNWDPCWSRAGAAEIRARKNAVRAVLPWVSLAHGNIRELNEFADSSDLETTLRRLEEWGVQGVVVHRGSQGAGFYANGSLIVEPPVPVTRQVNMTGTGDVLSVCMMLLHEQAEIPVPQRLQAANRIVSRFIEGRLQLIPEL
ncbi:MAG: carbohydrate kinase family protein [Verrucomicrobiota bacterium]